LQPVPAPSNGRVYRVGYLTPNNADFEAERFDRLQQSLRELGWAPGDNIVFERRLAEGQMQRLPDLAAELAALQPDVIVTANNAANVAAKNATLTTPIVFAADRDPVGTGLVPSFAHPGGNVTGVSEMADELAGKRVELLKQAVPGVARAGAIWNLADRAMAREYSETLRGAQALGVELVSLGVRTQEDLDTAYATAAGERIEAVIIIADPLTIRTRGQLLELAARHRLPTMSGDLGFALAGGLMSYGPNFTQMMQRAAHYVDRILKGARPADLPVEQPMLFDFVVNMKTAQNLGITIPKDILSQVTDVIE
jgi:putative ABC transport system substrate-binding protein